MHDKCSIYRNHSNIKACAETEQPYITYINHKSRFLNWESSKTYIQIFKNEQFGQVRMVEIDDKPYFVATDIAKTLGYKDTTNAIKQHCRWVVKHKVPHPQSKNKTLEVNVIPEGDMYRLITNSELPSAEKFESWVFDEVLPSIRKHGMYATDELINNPDLLIAAATKIKEAIR